MNLEQLLIGIFVAINVVAFLVVANDKRKSAQQGDSDRTPEGVLFFLAGAFGAGGVYLAMQLFRHKTKKWYFQIGIPLLILQNLAALYLFSELFS